MGSKLGWIISGAIIALVVIGIVVIVVVRNGMFQGLGQPTDATAAAKLEVINLDIDIKPLLVKEPQGTGAEKLYEEAVTMALAATGDPRDFSEMVRKNPAPEEDRTLRPILEKLEAAAAVGLDPNLELTFAALPIDPNTDYYTDRFLYNLASVASKAAISLNADKKKDEAYRAAQAALIFGDRLWKHGVYRTYRFAGMGATGEALATYGRIAENFGDKDKIDLCARLAASRKDGVQRWIEKERECLRTLRDLHPGDLARLADADKDRAWRIEGIMWLGVAQWTNARGGGQRTAVQKFLEQHTTSSDPVIAAKAKEALAFTRESVRSMTVE